MRYLFSLFLLLFATTALAQTVGSAVPSTAVALGARDSQGYMVHLKLCDSFAPISAAGGATAIVIPGYLNKKIHICGFLVSSAATQNVWFVQGTGVLCGTGQSNVTGPARVSATSGLVMTPSPFAVAVVNTVQTDLCIKSDGAGTIGGWISYTAQ